MSNTGKHLHKASDRNSHQIESYAPGTNVKVAVYDLRGTVGSCARPLSQTVAKHSRSAQKYAFARNRLARMQRTDDYLRKISICAECGGKALYYMMGKRYCKQHVALGKAAHAKKYTPRAK